MTFSAALPALADDLERIASVIATARRLIDEARAVDLAVLETKIGAVCHAVSALPRDEARLFLPTLEALVLDLDSLEAALRAHPPTGPARAQTAERAYRRLPAPPPGSPDSSPRPPSSSPSREP
ncbi:hypothetical protein [Pararhodospirillum oryzae]|uniref:Uncharacterized protein n=1 Tax=Pararhodospirillum oryzae TaxID=478448 RepID=A0A512H4E2_9PROT|nr:hypothetical protein [Pararhodospirillum oryzae]GEO80301.1 hypothetical protein ROR02_04320 [Pararhodospirillum oryzae]